MKCDRNINATVNKRIIVMGVTGIENILSILMTMTPVIARKRKSLYTNTPHAHRLKFRRQSQSNGTREERISRQSRRQRESRQSESCDVRDEGLFRQRRRQTESR
ncbi:Hypothetical predicted protein [Octopus vulgaris]|uniref:Uncharacterized protein n=1 Tax=Octopus vulgaris TaxID=6645 RepID=A0AA36AWM4_OCTVU|nr:Hypothetical predicted protein [Octopus vulgaris]